MERKALEQKLTGFFEELHMHPELSYEEYDTTAQIKKLLKAADVKILPIPMETGLIAEVKGEKDGPLQALRCDIDALPITELTDLPYASECPGKMHACGHDFHITAGLRSGCRNIRTSSVGQCGFSSSQEKSPPWAHGKCWKRRHSIRLRASGAFILIRPIWSMPSASGRAQLRRQ